MPYDKVTNTNRKTSNVLVCTQLRNFGDKTLSLGFPTLLRSSVSLSFITAVQGSLGDILFLISESYLNFDKLKHMKYSANTFSCRLTALRNCNKRISP